MTATMKRRLRLTTAYIHLLLCSILVGFVTASSPDALPSAASIAANNGPRLVSTSSTSSQTVSAIPPPNQGPLALPSTPWHPKQTLDQPGQERATATNQNNELPKPPHDSQSQQSPPLISNNYHHNHHPLSPVRRRRRRSPLWTIPFVASAASFVSFRRTSRIFHGLVQWMSSNTWIPKTFKELNLQANVVTQVINGPVITSISVLFASLVSMTISSLYQRQADIRLCLTNEIQALRILHTMLVPPPTTTSQQQQQPQQQHDAPMTPEEKHLAQAQDYLHQYIQYFAEEINSRGMKRPSSSSSTFNGDTNLSGDDEEDEEVDQPPPPLLALLAWCQQEPIFPVQETQVQTQPSSSFTASSSLLCANVSDWVCRLWSERSHRHLAWASTFPMVHYITLTFLAVGIGIAFLVATDQSTSIFLEGLPVRILWSILMGSFTALAVVCYDLSAPFGGAYQVTTATTI